MAESNYILTYDIGTTAIKLILFNTDLKVVYQSQKKVETYSKEGYNFQKAEDWWNIVIELTNEMVNDQIVDYAKIIAISSTGQMEDCLLLNEEGKPLTEVLLYSDGRAKKEYEFLVNKYNRETLDMMTGNKFDTLMSINKYLWLKNNREDSFQEHSHLILGSKDYINFKLTGNNITDYTNASTTGFLDINQMQLNEKIVKDLEMDIQKLPKIKKATDKIGNLSKKAANKLGLKAGIPVINGSGDVGASTLGAGAWEVGDIYCYLGTTSWLAMPSNDISNNRNLFTLSNIDGLSYIIAGAVLNAGQTYDWYLSNIMGIDEINNDVYEQVENQLKELNTEEITSIFIPYLNGERSPLKIDTNNGIFANIGSETDQFRMLYSVLEGVGFSLKHNMLEMLGNKNSKYIAMKNINLIGGGSKSKIWPQMLSNILESKVNILELETAAPSLGSAVIALKSLDIFNAGNNFEEIYKITDELYPEDSKLDYYRTKYEQYQKLVNQNFQN